MLLTEAIVGIEYRTQQKCDTVRSFSMGRATLINKDCVRYLQLFRRFPLLPLLRFS